MGFAVDGIRCTEGPTEETELRLLSSQNVSPRPECVWIRRQMSAQERRTRLGAIFIRGPRSAITRVPSELPIHLQQYSPSSAKKEIIEFPRTNLRAEDTKKPPPTCRKSSTTSQSTAFHSSSTALKNISICIETGMKSLRPFS